MTVRYYGGTYNRHSLKALSWELLCSLFYLEINHQPAFYSSPETCYAVVKCRIASEHALLDLLTRFRNVRLRYRGDELDYTTVPLCTPSILEACKRGCSFSRNIRLRVYSPESTLSVQLHSSHRPWCEISKCPYRLKSLIKDQKLDSVFGRNDHQLPVSKGQESKCYSNKIEEAAMQELQDSLTSVMDSLQLDSLQ